ncbi:MAG TPA: RHS repeat-associated core domain-containing protein, partial [Vicinamibacterales bacterium]|nr:RHS repeat-associated core domain-containing protein [Vicinamibacterales bacterium]
MELPVTSRRLGALVATFVLLVHTALDARAGIGRTPGFASVSEDGEAQYAIPIALPPGTNGMTPVLELAYSHRTRGGLVGIGWSIGGLSQITRCARTVAQDGIAGAPRRNTNDRFCLDGQRLVIVNSVVYGSPNAEYRTEVESFSRIRAVDGASTNGPASFTVEAADGRVYEYGATNDSRIDGTPGPSTNSARSWALSRIRDRAGNVIEYRYTEEPGSLAYRIASILYNANPTNGVAPSHEVRFVWEKRPDSEIDAGYVAGMPVREIMRLAAIEIRYGNATLRRVEFTYEPALSSGGRSRLATLSECGADETDCLSPTRFEWTDGTPGFGAVISFAALAPATGFYPEGKAWNLADLNGDGRDDYIWAGGSDLASSTVRYRLSQPDGAIGAMTDTGISARPGVGAPFDADGDGRTDLLLIAIGGFAVARGGPSGLGAPLATGVPTPTGLRDYRGADLNGDGLGDIAWSEVPDPQVNSLRVRAAFAHAGGGFGAPVTLYSQYEAVGYLNAEGGEFIGRPGQRIDFDGDGAEELLMNENDTFARISATAYGTEFFDAPPGKPVVLDFNDDRCTDFAYPHVASRSIRIRASECVIEGSRLELQGPAWIGSGDMLGLDWNGDGRDDLLTRGQRNWMVAVSLGDSATPFADTGVPHEASPAIAGRDLDGDGLQDIAVLTPGQLRARFRSGVVPDLLAGAIDGFGISTAFTYGPLTDPGLYARGSAATWPEPAVQTNELVVAALATTDGSGEGRLSSAQFRYVGLRRNVQGRGSLGFRKFTRVDGTGSDRLSTELTRRQDFPFTGLPESVVLRGPADVAVSSIDYRWSTLDIGTLMNARRFPWPSSITTRHFEPDGTFAGRELARTTSAIAAIDPASGLATDATTTTSELGGGANPGSQSSFRVQYTGVFNDSANWCLGRPLAVEITASHTLTGGGQLTRYADQSWDGPKCRPTRVRLLPGDAVSQVTYNLAYDAFGNVASEKVTGAGMAARTLATNWGSRGRLPARITDPLGQVARYAWDAGTGQPKSFTDPNGLVTQWDYDAFGRVIRERAADGTVTQWTREACATGCDPRSRYRLRQEDLDGTGVVRALATQEADRFDRAIRVETQEPGGGRSVATLDFGPRGEMTRRHLPHWDGAAAPGFVEFSYDVLGRPTGERLVEAGGALKRQSSNAYEGLSVTSTDALGHSTTATRLAWGPIAETVDALSGRTRYEYNAFGALARVRDASNGLVATIGYDARGWKNSVNDADRGAWAWTRNALGETTALRDAKGQLTKFEYDALGRMTKRTSPDGVAAWNWGKTPANRDIGRLASLSGPGYAENFAYDAAGRPASHVVTTDASYRFDYGYNALGLLDTLTYPAAGSGSPFRIRHDYDAGRLVRVGDASTAGRFLWTLNAADAAGHALDETFGASIQMVSGYSPVGGEIEYRQTRSASGTPAQDLAYRWDAGGNLASRQDLGQGVAEDFRYDALDRLTQSRRNGSVSLELEYDALGNVRRKSDVCSGTTPCYAYHATKRHAAVTAGTRAYAYDANGNMTSRAGAAIAWSSDDRPVSIAHANGNSSQFAYGPEGNRWKQVAITGGASETTIYVDGIFEKSTRGSLTRWRHFVMTPGGAALHLRFSDGTPATMRYLATDHLGSTDRILDSAGNVVAAESFGPFGARRKASWAGIPTAAELAAIAATARDGFTGHEQLDNVELIHMNGRVYDPQLGRFISADPYVMRPYDGQGLNRYSYALNNPLAFTDPSGFDPIPCAQTPEGHCAQITVIGVSWAEYMRAVGGAHSAEIASALERDPCGQNGSALACAMQTSRLVSPSSIQLTAGRQPDPTLASGGRLDSIRGFAARAANVAISSSPVAMLFGADPDFEYFRIPDNEAGR